MEEVYVGSQGQQGTVVPEEEEEKKKAGVSVFDGNVGCNSNILHGVTSQNTLIFVAKCRTNESLRLQTTLSHKA